MRGDLALAPVLDDAFELVVRGAPAAAALLVLTSIPLRFLEVRLVWELLDLGTKAGEHSAYLFGLSALSTLALVPAFWGRVVFARACSLALQGDSVERLDEAARPSLRAAFSGTFSVGGWLGFACGLNATLWIWVAAALLGWTVAALPLLALAGGFAAVVANQDERPRPWAVLLAALRALSPLRLTLGLAFSALAAWLVACVNLGVLFSLGQAAAEAVLGFDLPRWRAALGGESPLFILLLGAGGWLVVEPLFLGALASVVHRSRAMTTGEDLVAWFAEIRADAGKGSRA